MGIKQEEQEIDLKSLFICLSQIRTVYVYGDAQYRYFAAIYGDNDVIKS